MFKYTPSFVSFFQALSVGGLSNLNNKLFSELAFQVKNSSVGCFCQSLVL